MSITTLVFDVALVLGMTFTAWRVIATAYLFRSVVMFITFGLLMALAWVRLDAPDIALAEAAIGAGITGVLLLDAVGHLRRRPAVEEESDENAGE